MGCVGDKIATVEAIGSAAKTASREWIRQAATGMDVAGTGDLRHFNAGTRKM